MYRATKSVSSKQKEGHRDSVWSVSWISQSRLAGSVDENAKVWTIADDGQGDLELEHTLSGHLLGIVSTAATRRGGRDVLLATVRLWNLEDGEPSGSSMRGPSRRTRWRCRPMAVDCAGRSVGRRQRGTCRRATKAWRSKAGLKALPCRSPSRPTAPQS